MRTFVSFSSVVPVWSLWVLTLLGVVAAGLGPLASWFTAKRLARMALVACALVAVFVVVKPYVPIDAYCPDWMPTWWCFLLP